MFGLGPPELVLILLLVLIVFGAGKLPQVFGSLGKGVKEFRDASEGADQPTTTTTTTAATTNLNPPAATGYAAPTAPYTTPAGTTNPTSVTTETIETPTQNQ